MSDPRSTPELGARMDGATLVLTLNRPGSLNALNTPLLLALSRAIEDAVAAVDVSAVVITGAGDRAFSAGADIKEWMVNNDYASLERFFALGHRVFNAIETCPKPVLCAANGLAYGGGLELALACDLRIGGEEATFAFPEPTLGAFPGWGGLRRLVRIVGVARAKDIAMTARRVTADEASAIGILTGVARSSSVLAETLAKAVEIQHCAPLAITQVKRLCDTFADYPDARTDQYLEQSGNIMLSTTRDFEEGKTAFLEKRAPHFSGH